MERITVRGSEQVSGLLHRVAEGIAAGTIDMGGKRMSCSADIAAVVESPEDSEDEVLTVLLRLGGTVTPRKNLRVVQELTHPGG